MIKLSKTNYINSQDHSSKGNQFKWYKDGIWYKIDYLGYESLSEILVSRLLHTTNLKSYVHYEPEKVLWEDRVYQGCKSATFLRDKEEFWTCERLFYKYYGSSFAKELAGRTPEDKIRFFVEETEHLTGITGFGKYVACLLEVDALFLNEDRHTHNIGVIKQADGAFRPCPVFDNGAALFSDIRNDYPLDMSLEKCFQKIQAKPFTADFDTQLEIAEDLYGQQLFFDFSKWDLEHLLSPYEEVYGAEICGRIKEILYIQKRKYQYLGRK